MRKKIDQIDNEIVLLLKKRQTIARKIIEEKISQGKPVKDAKREEEIITRLRKLYDNNLVNKIYKEIFKSNY